MQCNIRIIPLIFFLALPSWATAQERGMWVWLHPDLESTEGHQRLLEFCNDHQIKRLFVEVTFSGAEGAKQLDRQELLRALLREASRRNIAIEALDGHQEMSLAKCRADTLHRLDLLIAFQRSLPEGERFAGLHYDMEPYLGERWKNGDEAGVMQETLETMAAIRSRVPPDTGLIVAYDIPSWYDRHPETLSITFQGKRKNFHEHIQDLSDYIGIMSYRRDSASMLDICKAEFAYGQKIGKKVYAGFETGELKEEPEITFYGATPETFWEVVSEVDLAKKDDPAYGGVILHYYGSLRELLVPKR